MNNLLNYIFIVWLRKHIRASYFSATTVVEHIDNPSATLVHNVQMLRNRKEQQLKQLEKETNYG